MPSSRRARRHRAAPTGWLRRVRRTRRRVEGTLRERLVPASSAQEGRRPALHGVSSFAGAPGDCSVFTHGGASPSGPSPFRPRCPPGPPSGQPGTGCEGPRWQPPTAALLAQGAARSRLARSAGPVPGTTSGCHAPRPLPEGGAWRLTSATGCPRPGCRPKASIRRVCVWGVRVRGQAQAPGPAGSAPWLPRAVRTMATGGSCGSGRSRARPLSAIVPGLLRCARRAGRTPALLGKLAARRVVDDVARQPHGELAVPIARGTGLHGAGHSTGCSAGTQPYSARTKWSPHRRTPRHSERDYCRGSEGTRGTHGVSVGRCGRGARHLRRERLAHEARRLPEGPRLEAVREHLQ
jgi:hypothetical protein